MATRASTRRRIAPGAAVERWLADYGAAGRRGDLLAQALSEGGAQEEHWRALLGGVASICGGDLGLLQERVTRQAHELGTGFRMPGDERERAWPISSLPLILPHAEWQLIEAGVAQRAELHERLLDDVYGPQALFAEGLLPAAVISGSPHFMRGMIGVPPPGPHRLHIYAADLARGPDGGWRVVTDFVRAPAGAGYALENRLAQSRVMGELLNLLNVERLTGFFSAFRNGLAAVCKRADPRIGLLTPGRYNQSYPEQAHLARYMGMLLVEGDDLVVTEDRLFVRTIEGMKRVDAVWRRIDARWLDPLAFDSRSAIGVPGLMDAMAAGNVVVANMPGAGVVESAAMAAFLPRLAPRLLHSELMLPNIATWWCGQSKERAEVEAMLERLLIAPAFGEAVAGLDGTAPVLGAGIAGEARARLLADLARRPQDYVGQEVVRASTVPAVIDGKLAARPFTLRVFAARDGEGRWTVMPGGFARLGDDGDVRIAVMGEGAFSADVCIVSEEAIEPRQTDLRDDVHIRRIAGTLQSRAADNLFWLGRYLERGEATLRLVRAGLGGTIEAAANTRTSKAVADRIADQLVRSGASAKRARAAKTRSMRVLALAALDDEAEAASVRGLLATAHAIAEGMRDRLAADVWRLLDAPLPPLPGQDSTSLLHRAAQLQERFSALAGLAAENMVRSSGWRFHDLGRRLERAAAGCRLVRAFAGDAATRDELVTLLDIQDSQISYRTRYPEGVALGAVRDLVGLESWNPRSIAFQIDRIAEHLAALPSLRDDGLPEEPVRVATWLKSALAMATARSLDDDLLAAIENKLYALSEAIGTRFFLQGGQTVRATNKMRLA